MRAFVALEITEAKVLDSMVSFQKELTSTGADLKPVERQNLHFTVKFLGELSAQQAKEVAARLGRLSLGGGEVEVAGVGAFPSASRPSVIWAGVKPENEALVSSVAQPVIEALEGIGESDDRPFKAHVTLARVRSRAPKPSLVSLLRTSSARQFGRTVLKDIRLKSSTLTPSGPVYTDQGVFPLR